MNLATNVTPPTKEVWYQRKGWRWIGYDSTYPLWRRILIFFFWIVVLLFLLWALIGIISKIVDDVRLNSLNPPPLAGPSVTAAPAPTPTVLTPPPTSSPPPSSSPSPSQAQRCTSPAEPASGKIGLVIKGAASDTAWLANFKGTALTRAVYNGDPANPEALKAWANAAACNNFSAEIRPDKISGNIGEMQGANTVSALCWDQWYAGYTSSCRNDYLPVFLPFPTPNDYGSPDSYTDVGRAATSGWAAVQAFSWREAISGPNPNPEEVKMVNDKHFPDYPVNGRPTPEQVGKFAQQLHDGGVNNILIYTEYPAAGDVNYLKACIEQVAKALGR